MAAGPYGRRSCGAFDVHINRIEVQSDDPDRFAFGLEESAAALKRVADQRSAERSARDQAAVAASTTPCQSYGCTGRMVRVEGTVGYGCSKCNAWESALTAESRGQGTATRVSAAALPAHWERKPDSAFAHLTEAMKPLMEAEMLRMNARAIAQAGREPLFAQQGETDAPGTPRPADCTCTSFARCLACLRHAAELAHDEIMAAMERGCEREVAQIYGDPRIPVVCSCGGKLQHEQAGDFTKWRCTRARCGNNGAVATRSSCCPGCGVPSGANCAAECPDMAARIAAAEPLQSMRIRAADCHCGPHIMCVPCKKLEITAKLDPLDVEYDGVKLRGLVVMDGVRQGLDAEYVAPFTPVQRAAVSAHWSAQLRAKVEAAKQAERNVVTYCELDPDD